MHLKFKLILAATVLFLASSLHAANDLFLKIDPLKGESKAAGFVDQIDILAWSWGMSTPSVPGDLGAGKVSFQDLSFTKYFDTASPGLMLGCASGNVFDQVIFSVRRPGGATAPAAYLVITLTDVRVTSVSSGGSGGEDRFTENVTLNFAKVELEYKPQNPDGSLGTKVPFKWDVLRNSPN